MLLEGWGLGDRSIRLRDRKAWCYATESQTKRVEEARPPQRRWMALSQSEAGGVKAVRGNPEPQGGRGQETGSGVRTARAGLKLRR